jgi:hypothetical protein
MKLKNLQFFMIFANGWKKILENDIIVKILGN